MLLRGTFLLLATSLATPIVLAQATGNLPASPTRSFEVASIRPHQGLLRVMRGFSSSGPRLTLEGYNRMYLIMEAYNLKDYQVSASEPELQSGTYFDITAIAEGNTNPTRDEFRQMLQTLLAQRFNLKIHFISKETNVYALIISKSGPKFKSSGPGASEMRRFDGHGRNNIMSIPLETMESLAADIAIYGIDRPVVDKTGLIGTYDIKLEATPEFRMVRNPEPEDISVFTAIQDQLGLKLEPAKASTQILMVDHIEKPTEN